MPSSMRQTPRRQLELTSRVQTRDRATDWERRSDAGDDAATPAQLDRSPPT